ncbi:Translocation and assembly module TamA [Saliniradius amylolyticus]|uniref:Translocation and assembly module subunit TamA n=1 Tax=Saliniradius amylolyticus TaxID=2183582 RepID=A0A2S2E5I3_9ALTE|nr:autotransporter assembly complex family protein [Saliniradius amylolyticus]AWL12859.1 Translocation and assembly module TamA [Saliniradius amylolyticus]
MSIRQLTALLLSLCLAVPLSADPILEIDIEGVEGPLEKNIRAHLGPIPDSPELISRYAASARKHSRQALIALGYNQASVKTRLSRSKSPPRLNISVLPGRRTLIQDVSLTVTSPEPLADEFKQVIEHIKQLKGQPLHHGEYDSAKQRLDNTARTLGYLDGQWQNHTLKVHPNSASAEILWHYNAGRRYRIDQILFKGTDVSEDLLFRMSPIKEGQYYHSNLLSRLDNALRQTGYFSDVLVSPDFKQKTDRGVPLVVSLTDAPDHSIKLGLGYVTDTGPRASIGWKTPKVNAAGHSQETVLRYSPVNPYASFLYSIPGQSPLKQQYQLGLTLEENEFGDLKSRQASAIVAWQDSDRKWVSRYELRWLTEEWDIFRQSFDADYLLLGAQFSTTRRKGSINDPSSGFQQNYQIQATDESLGASDSLIQLVADWKWVKRWQAHRLVLRARAGINLKSNDNPRSVAPSLRFFAGGDNSLRGFDYHSLGPSITVTDPENGDQQNLVVGGNRLLTGTLEYQYYLSESWRVPLFTDAGNAFNNEDMDVIQSVGSGIHWLSPVGPIRFEFGYGISEDDPPWRLHISMGAEF